MKIKINKKTTSLYTVGVHSTEHRNKSNNAAVHSTGKLVITTSRKLNGT